jgi:hypothetical protein
MHKAILNSPVALPNEWLSLLIRISSSTVHNQCGYAESSIATGVSLSLYIFRPLSGVPAGKLDSVAVVWVPEPSLASTAPGNIAGGTVNGCAAAGAEGDPAGMGGAGVAVGAARPYREARQKKRGTPFCCLAAKATGNPLGAFDRESRERHCAQIIFNE